MDEREVLSRVVDLLWKQHGGSGLGITWEEAWDLEWGELVALLEEVEQRRSAEAAAIRRASSSKGKR